MRRLIIHLNFKFRGSFRVSTTRATTKNKRTNNTVKKYQPTKALEWHVTCRKKLWKRNRGHNLDSAFLG